MLFVLFFCSFVLLCFLLLRKRDERWEEPEADRDHDRGDREQTTRNALKEGRSRGEARGNHLEVGTVGSTRHSRSRSRSRSFLSLLHKLSRFEMLIIITAPHTHFTNDTPNADMAIRTSNTALATEVGVVRRVVRVVVVDAQGAGGHGGSSEDGFSFLLFDLLLLLLFLFCVFQVVDYVAGHVLEGLG